MMICQKYSKVIKSIFKSFTFKINSVLDTFGRLVEKKYKMFIASKLVYLEQ